MAEADATSFDHSEQEEWRPVVGMESFYEVSNLGSVRTLHRVGRGCRKKILSPVSNKKGYLRVRLTGNGRSFSRVVHLLVLEAFIPRPSSVHECNHKDGVKANNLLSNLEWLLPVENNRHARELGLWHPHIGDAHGRAIIREADIPFIRSQEGVVSARKLAKELGVTSTTILSIWKRKNWKHVP